ncbi:MAG TPA: hypothetical protein VKA86_12420 [Candidatus Krumholzibacteria bacterium]|nr:hypothetical protein [Candidatus Krumholzibacteria bacterium]
MSRPLLGSVLLAAAIALAACETDLYVPVDGDVTFGPVNPLGGHAAWIPVVRVIEPDGTERTDYEIDVDNRIYFENAPRGRELAKRVTLSSGDVATDDDAVHPPFVLRLSGDRGPDFHFDLDLTPAPGETLVVDYREPTLRIAVDADVPERWGAPAVTVQARIRSRYSDELDWIRAFRVVLVVETTGDGPAPLILPATADSLLDARLEWSWSNDAGDGSAEWYRGQIVSNAGNVALDPRQRALRLQLVRAGGPIADTRVRFFSRWSDDEERTAWFVREGRVVGGGPAQMIGLADRGIVDVVCLQAGQWFVSQRAYAGDFTRPGVVVHELGEFDLVVEVVDSAGRAVGGAEVGVAPAASFATPARNVTGAEGRVTYAVGQDFYDVVVSLSGEETPTRATAYVARDDTLRVELQP